MTSKTQEDFGCQREYKATGELGVGARNRIISRLGGMLTVTWSKLMSRLMSKSPLVHICPHVELLSLNEYPGDRKITLSQGVPIFSQLNSTVSTYFLP